MKEEALLEALKGLVAQFDAEDLKQFEDDDMPDDMEMDDMDMDIDMDEDDMDDMFGSKKKKKKIYE